mmetsp:Transcript_12971/g.29496  ORF Transcript_12971/g.29496 Transcript_12971/m.29496 type:complete len:204 (-) Transcript_12971:71-682(-)
MSTANSTAARSTSVLPMDMADLDPWTATRVTSRMPSDADPSRGSTLGQSGPGHLVFWLLNGLQSRSRCSSSLTRTSPQTWPATIRSLTPGRTSMSSPTCLSRGPAIPSGSRRSCSTSSSAVMQRAADGNAVLAPTRRRWPRQREAASMDFLSQETAAPSMSRASCRIPTCASKHSSRSITSRSSRHPGVVASPPRHSCGTVHS